MGSFALHAGTGNEKGHQMKAILLNGSPRKNWNTHKLLMEAERGAKEMGAETEIIHLYDLNYTDCRSCFACKVKGNQDKWRLRCPR
jgi:multimeric flavodoxin WrbA